MIEKTLAHYEITTPIGKGGMGDVYRAKDTKLGRDDEDCQARASGEGESPPLTPESLSYFIAGICPTLADGEQSPSIYKSNYRLY